MKSNSILLLSGSHRGIKTTTNSILNYIEKKLSTSNIAIFRKQVPVTNSEIQFISQINDVLHQCDTIVLCFPLYFDTLPYPLISTLELLSNQIMNNKRINFFTIVHCGLPEAAHCDNALNVCKSFSENMGFHYSGSAIIPDTGAIDGSSIARTTRIRSILDNLIDNISCTGITNHKAEFIAKPSMRPFFFKLFGNIIMKHFAKKNKVSVFQKAYDNYYLKE